MAFLAKSLMKCTTWILRLFQNIFALILIGVCGYMLHQFNQFHFRNPQEVVVPMLFVRFQTHQWVRKQPADICARRAA
jgi:hypothetical protein